MIPDEPASGLTSETESVQQPSSLTVGHDAAPRRALLDRAKAAARSVWIQRVVLAAAVAALTFTTVQRWDDIIAAVQDIGIAGLTAAALAALVAVILQWRAWHILMAEFGANLRWPTSTGIYGLSVMGKYLPGGVWTTLLQVELSATAGVRRWATLAASVTAMLLTVVVGGATGVLAIPSVVNEVDGSVWFWLLALLPVLLVLHPRVLNRLVARAVNTTGDRPVARLRGGSLAQAALWTLGSWLLLGLQLSELSQPFGGIPVLEATAGFALAWTLGFLFLVAPAGAGVRDVILVAVLTTYVDRSAAVALALISRAVLTFVDFAVGGGSLLAARRVRTTASMSVRGSL